MNTSGDDSRIGLILNGRYRIAERLAEGGMGVVYKGERVQLGRPVAIKFLHEPLTKDHQFRVRFEMEARAMSQLSHPNCVSVIDFGVEDAPYIVMDYVTGKTLRQLTDEGRVPPGRAMHISKQLLASLAHAHKHGIIHRDIKPANVMLSEATGMGDHVRIFDFGLAKLLDPISGEELSRTNVVVGTPNYMSPEQSLGQNVDTRSDLYSTAVVIFELLTGRKPFVDENAYNVVQMHREMPPPTLAMASDGEEFSQELEAAIAKALEKDPDRRFQSAKAFAEALAGTPEARLSPMVIDYESDSALRAPPAREASGPNVAYAKTEELQAPKNTRSSTHRNEIPQSSRVSGTGLRVQKNRQAFTGGAKIAAVIIPILLILPAGVWFALRHNQGQPGAETAKARILASNEEPASQAAILDTESAADAQIEADEGDLAKNSKVDIDLTTEPSTAEIAETDTAATTPPVKSGKMTKPPSLEEIQDLIASKNYDTAIMGLKLLRQESPQKGVYPYMQAEIFFERKWYKDAVEHYGEAVRLNPGLRKKMSINKNLISLLGTDKIYRKARWMLIREVGRPALPYLRRAVKTDPNQLIKKRAKNIARIIAKGSR